jgi:hypothetical protein
MGDCNVRVSADTHSFLKRYKRDNNLSSLDEAIQHLHQQVVGNAHASFSSSQEENRLIVADAPLFSAAWFSREEKARKYFCGLSDDAFEWLEEQFLPEVCATFLSHLGCFVFCVFVDNETTSPIS